MTFDLLFIEFVLMLYVKSICCACITKGACMPFVHGIEVFMWLDCSCNTGYYA